MQWLNKVDNALDWVLGSSQPNAEEEEGSSSIDVDENESAARRQRSENNDNTVVVVVNDLNNSTKPGRKGPMSVADQHVGVAINESATINTATYKARPPPPPPPPPATRPATRTTTRTTTREATTKAEHTSSSSSLPSNISQISLPMTKPNNHAESSHAAESESEQPTPTPLLLQIQDIARASPAPSKVTIGDRQPLTESLFKLSLPDLDSQQQSGNENDRSDNPMTSNLLLPPTPPRSSSNQNAEHGGNRTLQSEQQLTSLKINAHEPPSPSTFVIHLPTNEQGEQLPHLPSPININTQFHPPPSMGHNPQQIPAEPARSGAALATTSTTSRATPRPMPGVIRRRLREPSLSPPDSPSHSTSGSVDHEIPHKTFSSLYGPSERQDNAIDAPMKVVDWFKRMGSTDGGVNNDTAEHNNHANDHDDASFSDDGSFHSQTSTDSELTESNMLDDFALPPPSLSSSPIIQDNDDTAVARSWDPSFNCYGFFHVRLLRAQRLPCPSGSSINATISLQPWKGCIRVPSHSTIDGPEGAGVCLRWDKRYDPKRGGGARDRVVVASSSESKAYGDSTELDQYSHSMVHAYNNVDTPVPTIVVELTITSLGGVFDRHLCSITVPCHDLMRNPRSWRHKWHPASLIQGMNIQFDSDEIDSAPLILLESCFEPMTARVIPEQVSSDVIGDTDTVNVSGDSDTLGSIPNIVGPAHNHHHRRRRGLIDDDSTSKSSTLTPALVPRSSSITKTHLLRVRTFWTPTWCAVCSQSIISGWMKGKSYECEECGIYCCRDCHLQVDARIPCGSELASIAVKKAQQYQLPSFGQIMSTLAPELGGTNAAGAGDSTLNNRENVSPNIGSVRSGGPLKGIGVMHVKVLSACLFDKTFPPEAEPNVVFESDSNLHNGDHYVRVSWLGSKESKRTKTVLQTPKPLFDSDVMIFDVPHYGMEYKLEVVDANTDKPIGSCLLSTQGVLQWQRDDMFAQPDRILLSLFHLRKYSEPRRIKLELRTGVKDGFGLNFYNSSEVAGGKQTTQRPGEISGWLEIDVLLEEDRSLFYSINPRRCPQKSDEEFDIALIQLHIARITAITEFIQNLVFAYMHVVSWDNRQLTGTTLVSS
jgi:hypothetical protein